MTKVRAPSTLALALSIPLLACSAKGNLSGNVGPEPTDPNNPNPDPNNPDPTQVVPFVASTSGVRRLTRAELNNTLRDVFGDDGGAANQFLSEEEYTPYDNDYTLQEASQPLIEGLELLAEDVAKRMLADPSKRSALVPCTPNGPGDQACFTQVIEHLAKRALRRPIAQEDVDAYLELLQFATENNPYVSNGFDTAVELLIRALIQDPEFLYRIEVGTPQGEPGVFALSGREIATRLSYLLWGTSPSEALLDDADLADPAKRKAWAETMLEDPRAKSQLARFHSMWLGYRALPQAPALVDAFAKETNALINRVVFDEPQSYLELFRSKETYVDDMLADHYGLPHPQGGEGWVSYQRPEQAGILSHGSVLSAFSKFSDTSPTQRGIFVRTRLMCERIAPPPATVDTDKPPAGETEGLCKIDRYKAHFSRSGCVECHSQMDPIGFGLENFDNAGRYREHDDGRPECIIDGKGELPNVGEFSGPSELAQRLIDEGRIDQCLVQQWMSFAVGRAKLDAAEKSRVGTLTDRFRQTDHSLTELLIEYVQSEPFALRREEAN